MKRITKIILMTVLLFSFTGCKKNEGCDCANDIYTEENIIHVIQNQYSALYEQVINQTVSVMSENSLGSGFVFEEDNEKAYIMTNAHVLTNLSKIEVLHPNQMRVKAEFFAWSNASNEDVAVITIPRSANYELATLGNSDSTKQGEVVFAIGSPLSVDFRGAISSGVVSAKNVHVVNPVEGFDRYMTMIDVTINPGNSGGPLYNLNGEVIGINTMKSKHESSSTDDYVNFAIPINLAKHIHYNYFKEGTTFVKPKLKIRYVEIASLSFGQRQDLNIDLSITSGLYVLENNDKYQVDIIVGIYDKDIHKMSDLDLELLNYRVGDKVQLRVIDKDGTNPRTQMAELFGND